VPFLPGHDVQTVAGAGWAGIKNGDLLKRIEAAEFNAFITGDKRMEMQQRLTGRPFCIRVLSAINWGVIRPHVQRIAAALETCESGTIQTIDCGVFIPRRLRRPKG